MATIDDVKASYKAIFRIELNDAAATATASAIDGGQLSLLQYQNSLIAQSAPTTQAALSMAVLITGVVPTSEKLDSLTAFAKLQNDYYTNTLHSANAQLGAYEALGKAYAADPTTSASFAAKFGDLSVTDFVTAAYTSVFAAAPTAGAAANLQGQVNYFVGIYTQSGMSAADAMLQAKGAVFGQIVGYAVTAPAAGGVSVLDDQVNAALLAIAQEAVAGTDPSTIYGEPLAGVGGALLSISSDESISLDQTAAALKATVYNDSVSGDIHNHSNAVSVNTAAGDDSIGTAGDFVSIYDHGVGNGTIVIDGSAGTDSLYAVSSVGLSDNVTIKNVEKIFLDGNGSGLMTAKNWTGYQELWSLNATGTTEIDEIAAGVQLGVKNNAGSDTTFSLAADGAANVKLDNVTSALLTVNSATSLTVDVVANSTSSIIAGDAKSLVISGSGNLVAANIDLNGAYTSVDASASTGLVALAGLESSSVNSTFKLTAKADQLGLAINSQKNVSITTGAGNDVVTISAGGNVSSNDVTKTSLTTITDFVSKSDVLNVSAIATGTDVVLTGADITAIAGLSLQGAVDYIALNKFAAAGDNTSFTFGSDSYVLVNGAADTTFGAGDTLIKLAGVSAIATGDILVA